jgi:hypothetical protein
MGSRQRGIILLATLLGGAASLHFSPAVHAASAAAASDSAFASGDSVAASNLAASTGVPWNPPGALPDEDSWERVARFPGLVVSWPLRQIGTLIDRGLVSAEDTKLIPKALAIAQVPAAHGLVLLPASLGDRTGLGVAARLYPPRIGTFLNLEWDGSTLQYSRTTLRAGYGPAWLEYQYEWRPEDGFFGIGLGSSPHEESNYAAEFQHLLLTLNQGLRAGPGRLALRGWFGERSLVTRPGKGSDSPSFDQAFPSLGGMVDLHEDYVTGGASALYDARSKGIQRWVGGWRVGVTAEGFAEQSGARLLFPASDATSRFTRLRYDAEAGHSFFMADPRTVRLAARLVDQHVNDGLILLPDLVSLGGNDGLAGFEPRRFHDIDAALLRLTYLFPLGKHLELDVHTEAGGVYGDVWRDAKLSTLRHSYGVALRPRSDTALLGALGLDWSAETVRFHYSIGGAE